MLDSCGIIWYEFRDTYRTPPVIVLFIAKVMIKERESPYRLKDSNHSLLEEGKALRESP